MSVIKVERDEVILTQDQWNLAIEAVNWVLDQVRKDPKFRRFDRKRTARETKSARILARQIARSEHHIRARPLLRNGKAWR